MSDAQLFDEPPRARRDGPETSRQAAAHVAESGVASRQCSVCLAAVIRWPGRTTAELAANIEKVWKENYTPHIVGRRLPELRARDLIRNGPVRRCKATARRAMTWVPA